MKQAWEAFMERTETDLKFNGNILEDLLVKRYDSNTDDIYLTIRIRVLLGDREQLLRNLGEW